MENNTDCVRLVKRAQCGDKECLGRLTKAAEERLRTNVYRLTLEHHLTQDIVQETILEMLRVLNELKEADRFWPWLYKIALNKIRLHHRVEQHQRVVPVPAKRDVQSDSQEAVSNMVSEELKQIVFKAMTELKPQHRAVLILRCYEEMNYSQIGESMGCSEPAAQMLFCRAKKALKKQLSREGFGKGSLLMALVLFGKMTAASEAAAANISITAGTAKVGLAAGLVGAVTGKVTVVSLTTAGVLAIGTLLVTSKTKQSVVVPVASRERPPRSLYVTPRGMQASEGDVECWYYYPPNGNGAVLMQLKSDADGGQSYSQWLQNDQANYYKRKNIIYINNYRTWASDLTVGRLPTDSPQLTDFLSQVEGTTKPLKYVQDDSSGLLVIVKQNENGDHLQVTHRYDASNEEYFRYSWSARAKIIDNRDAMHKRGWTYFRIIGRIDGEQVQGTGRIPFVYAASKRYSPWLRLKLKDREIVDDGDGRLFKGLGRPWMGLHSIDTVRRDAAEQRVWFQTELLSGNTRAQVVLDCERTKLVYTIDMEKDVVERIAFSGGAEGELEFDYLQDIDDISSEFIVPSTGRYRVAERSEGILWLVRLAERTLGKSGPKTQVTN